MVQGPPDMLNKGDSELPENEERLYDIGELSDEKQDLLSAHEKYKFFNCLTTVLLNIVPYGRVTFLVVLEILKH